MTTSQVVEMSITVNNSPIQDYIHPQDYTQPTYELTPGFKCFTVRVIKHENKNGQESRINNEMQFFLCTCIKLKVNTSSLCTKQLYLATTLILSNL